MGDPRGVLWDQLIDRGVTKMRNLQRVASVVLGMSFLAGCGSSIASLEVGDCYNAPEIEYSGTTVSDVDVVDCSEPHRYELFAIKQMTESSYPGESQAGGMANDYCISRFESFVGIDYDSSIYYVFSVFPLRESWSQGDRSIQCAVGLDSGTKVGSARNAQS